MQYTSHYQSSLGLILLAADEANLTGLWFEDQKYFAAKLDPAHRERELPVFSNAKRWLDLYFAGQKPDFTPPLRFSGTEFQNAVWRILCTIPHGETITYGEIARRLGCRSAQAVGGAVGRNPISIIVPCHRVVGANGSMTGYAGGIDKKIALLQLEGVAL